MRAHGFAINAFLKTKRVKLRRGKEKSKQIVLKEGTLLAFYGEGDWKWRYMRGMPAARAAERSESGQTEAWTSPM